MDARRLTGRLVRGPNTYIFASSVSPAASLCGLSVDAIINGSNRFLRKVATVQICRHWDRIISLARNRNIPRKDLAVRVVYNAFPFRIEAFDYHELLDDSKYPPHHVLVGNEVQRWSRRRRRDNPCDLPVVLRMGNIEVPYITHLNNLWTKKSTFSPPNCTDDGEGGIVTYIDQDGCPFDCETVDALRAAIRFAQRYARELRKPVWSEDVLHKMTMAMLDEVFESDDGWI